MTVRGDQIADRQSKSGVFVNEVLDPGDSGLLETINKDPQAYIRNQSWAAVSLDGPQSLIELRSLYEHLQARILELIETLDEVRASPDYEIYQVAEQDAAVIERIAAAQRAEVEEEIAGLKGVAERLAAEEVRELVGAVPF
ncbi:MAG: hypothetical protein K9N23_16860 [Akkermansiaceae bacterium]|nr:hypothetical protein [Akkermansiaceae bacterium]MCF7733363.1 hypothetical protein [Akkermansiaceae bacterium]